MLIVKKFGGSSVADKEKIYRVAHRCVEEYRKGNQVVVVLSAMGDTTDHLIEMAETISPHPSKREMDMLLVTGEQISVSLMAMAIQELGVPAISLNAFQVMMHCTSNYSDARFKRIDQERIEHELESGKIVLVTGFQGINKYDDYTTLGRGGSDTTAVALAAALHAEKCEIYTDVDGVFTADPRVVPSARQLTEITYDEMLELAAHGAKVLHNRSVEMAKKYSVPLEVRSSLHLHPGTILREVVKVENMLVTGIAGEKNVARISAMGMKNQPGITFKMFNLLAKAKINVDMILQSVERDGTKDISFTIAESDAKEAVDVLTSHQKELSIEEIECIKEVAKVSIVGAGMMSNAGVASRMFAAMYDNGISMDMISTSEIRITALIPLKDLDLALNALHDEFRLGME